MIRAFNTRCVRLIKPARALGLLIGVGLALTLAACGRGALLSDVSMSGVSGASGTAVITPNGDGQDDSLSVSYTIGQTARVSVWLEGSGGQRYTIRDNVARVPSSEPYSLRFDGTVAGDQPGVVQRVIPDGTYTLIVEAMPESGGQSQRQSFQLEVRDAAQLAEGDSLIQDLSVTPEFSPNEDADADVAYFSYRLPVSSTVAINFTDPAGNVIPFISAQEGPFAQSHIWDGKRPDGALVTSGTYTYTIVAQDAVGNITQREGQIAVENPGRSEARITFVQIAPVEIAISNTVTVTIRVKNTGNIPIRTQGPASGFRYTTEQMFSSIEDNRWNEKGGGFWRVGLDWGGGHGYPFRWTMSPRPIDQWASPGEFDYLQPGEEAEITGSVQVLQREDRMEFYAGLVHEGVGYPENNKGRTLVCVGIPGIEDRCPRRAP